MSALIEIVMKAGFQSLCEQSGVTRIADLTGLDRLGINVVTAVRPMGRSLSSSQGKGLCLESACLSAVGEAIEIWRLEQLADTYKSEHVEFIQDDDFAEVYDAESLAESISLDLRRCSIGKLPAPGRNTNGVGSSWMLEQAIDHACLELIERKSLELWCRLDPRKRLERLVDNLFIRSLDQSLSRLMEVFDDCNIEVIVWDITLSKSAPCFLAVVGDVDAWLNPMLYEGSACHCSVYVAITKALVEAAQSRLTLIAGSRDDMPLSFYNQYLADAPRRSSPPRGYHRPECLERNFSPLGALMDLNRRFSPESKPNGLILRHGDPSYYTVKIHSLSFLPISREFK